MNQEDRDQIVAALRKEAESKREDAREIEKAGPDRTGSAFTVLAQANTYAKLAEIFKSLQAE